MRLIVFYLFVLIGIGSVFYLSWVPNPHLGALWFFPNWLATWTDANENDAIRTGVPFVVLGVVIGARYLKFRYSWYWWIGVWLGLVAIVLIAELGQLSLPNRFFDWWDVVWGAVGSAAGMGMALFGRALKTLAVSS